MCLLVNNLASFQYQSVSFRKCVSTKQYGKANIQKYSTCFDGINKMVSDSRKSREPLYLHMK